MSELVVRRVVEVLAGLVALVGLYVQVVDAGFLLHAVERLYWDIIWHHVGSALALLVAPVLLVLLWRVGIRVALSATMMSVGAGVILHDAHLFPYVMDRDGLPYVMHYAGLGVLFIAIPAVILAEAARGDRA